MPDLASTDGIAGRRRVGIPALTTCDALFHFSDRNFGSGALEAKAVILISFLGLFAAQPAPARTAAPQPIRLTGIDDFFADPSCEISLVRNGPTVAGISFSEGDRWKFGINGRTYVLNEISSPSQNFWLLRSRDRSITARITFGRILAESKDESAPSRTTAVTIALTVNGRSATFSGRQYCSDH